MCTVTFPFLDVFGSARDGRNIYDNAAMSPLLANVTAAPAVDSRDPDPLKVDSEKLQNAFVTLETPEYH